ncbi:hypothetical protein TNCV_4602521 [Trichonephila clavipes]|nr:hypothetical protein TNCV_4602521 [Trichonephila clavipes]
MEKQVAQMLYEKGLYSEYQALHFPLRSLHESEFSIMKTAWVLDRIWRFQFPFLEIMGCLSISSREGKKTYSTQYRVSCQTYQGDEVSISFLADSHVDRKSPKDPE